MNISERGWFISFEGSEGCGKSTQIALLESLLEDSGRTVKRLREPGGTPLGEEIRRLLQYADEGEGMCPEAELLLFGASRAEIVRHVVRPWLAMPGHVVLADRFLDSTTVYQGVARGLGLETVGMVNGLATGGTVPDVTLLLDLPVDEGTRRTEGREEPPDRIERESSSFFQRVRDGYLDLARREPGRFVIIDAADSPDAVHAAIVKSLRQRLDGLFS